jgi:hypothetical protein
LLADAVPVVAAEPLPPLITGFAAASACFVNNINAVNRTETHVGTNSSLAMRPMVKVWVIDN